MVVAKLGLETSDARIAHGGLGGDRAATQETSIEEVGQLNWSAKKMK